MQIIQVIENNGTYTCDIGISKYEWLEILESPTTQKEFIETLLCFYYMPEHRGSCTQTSREMGFSATALSRHVSMFGNFVKKRLNRFEVIGTDGKPSQWIIPMGEGRRMGMNEEGTFEWQLRKELVEAIEEYLYHYLVKRYKELRKELPINSNKYYELYKWEIIKDCKDKNAFFIVQRLRNENLIDKQRDRSVINYMLNIEPEKYQQILSSLLEETTPLNDRLRDFKQSMIVSLPETINGKRIVGKANDERMASAILTCHNPQKYTFYKNDVYVKLCQYLGVNDKYAGECYEHFLELLKPLQQQVESDKELQEVIADSLKEHEFNSLLLSQDVLWEILICWPKQLDFIQSLVWRPRYWFVGFNFKHNESQFDRFVAEGIWEGRFERDKRQISDARKIKVGDILILKSTFTYQKTISCLRVCGIGIVTETRDEEINGDGLISVIRSVKYINLDKKDFEGYGQYRSTIQECKTKEKEIIDYINGILSMEQQKKYDKYTELLRANYNLVLTGAPGTGKTYLAKEIAKEMGADDDSIEFVQFHPSYDYTDFVEGLRPTKADNNGYTGFERKNGVFKEFCLKALRYETNIFSKAQKAIENFKTDLKKEKQISITSFRSETVIKISLTAKDTISVLNKSKEYTISDDKMLHYIVSGECSERDTYTHSIGDYVKEKYMIDSFDHQRKFVFIIDEINRGDLSKIFGELFFCIDPGYRGEKGLVKTQYQNLITDSTDPFYKGFYIPKNVFIIGTMNDIDRSVESMDFAMRRRFVWKEISAEESYIEMIASDMEFFQLKDEIHARMTHLNKAILDSKLGLGEAYQIGAAYFRKVRQYTETNSDTAFDSLWNNHLKCLLAEYLRGNANSAEQLETLRLAYNNTEIDNDLNNEG